MKTPAQVARIANVHPNSVRNWSQRYSKFFSPHARGEHGPRQFEDADVQTLCAIADLIKSGVSPSEIPDRLRDTTTPPIVDATPHEVPHDPPPSHTDAPETAIVPLVVYNSLHARIEAQNARFSALEARFETLLRAALLWGVLLGAIAAFALGAFILWVLYLAANAP